MTLGTREQREHSYVYDDVKLAFIQQQFRMKECDILRGGGVKTMTLLHFLRGQGPQSHDLRP